MTTPDSRVSRKSRRIVSLLLPLMIVIFWRASPVAACSQESVPARVELVRDLPVAPRPAEVKGGVALDLHSISHPFPPVPQQREYGGIPFMGGFGYGQATLPVAAGEKATWYSAYANQIHCSLLLPNATWLGTEFGLKRLDNQAKTVRHFCALDGLPYNRITGIAGQETQLYCCAEKITVEDPRRSQDETGPHHTAVALCRYHAESGRWEAVAEETRSYPQGIQVGPPEASKSKSKSKYRTFDYERVERQYVAVGGDHACLVMGPGIPEQGFVLVASGQSGAIERIFCPSFAKAAFQVFFAHADAESLWIGSDIGLLHYDFKARQWERLLSDMVVTGASPAAKGGLWLLTLRFDPAHQDRDGNRVQTEHWQITRFMRGTNAEHFALTDQEIRENVGGAAISFVNIVVVGDRVWTTQQRFLSDGHGQMAYYPAVYALNIPTRQVTLEAPFGSGERKYEAVPDAALANALTGWRVPVPLHMPTRFPGWTCLPDENHLAQLKLPSPNAASGADEADGLWFTRGESSNEPGGSYSRHVLAHVGPQNEARDSYTFPAFTVKTHEPVSAPVVLGEKVYFLSEQESMRLYTWDRKTDQVVPIPEMDAALTQSKADWRETYRLMSDGASLWVGTGQSVLRYNLKTKQVYVWNGDRSQSASWAYPYALLTVTGGKAWIKGAPNRLLTAGDSTTSTQMVPVVIPSFPAELEQNRADSTLFAMEDGIVWFHTKSAAAPRHSVLIGYRTQSDTWTTPYKGALSLSAAAATANIVKQGAIQWFYGASFAIGYNTETGQWQTLPPIPIAMEAYSPLLASVDEGSAWALSDSKLLHLNRARNTWSSEETPFHLFPFWTPPSVRDGNSLLVPTQVGLWTIDLATKQVKQAPAILSAGKLNTFTKFNNFYVVAVDHNAVWVVGGGQGEGFLIRFDRKTHAWNTIPAQEGVSVKQFNGAQWSADGVSCWLRTPKDTYHLNIKTNRWENVSVRLAGKQSRIVFQQIVTDDEDVWLVAALVDENYVPLPHPPTVPLYRYHLKTDTFVAIQPAPGVPLMTHFLTANKDSVLLAASEGNYRFDRATKRWDILPLPVLPVGLPLLQTLAVYEEAGSYWFVGKDSSLQVKGDAMPPTRP